MATNKTDKTPMRVETIKAFAQSRGFISVADSIRVNENGYPFVTFVDDKNVAENVYFSKEAGNSIVAGQVIDGDTLKGFQIGYTMNEAGEERIKLISNSKRILLTDLF